ncbi:hypothetical protein BDR26DRAFT_849730 [Obelidium mucronatum]|nr:hypothetical protein BDR26DRAFT_849730 [Obelidium mucronatum]
MAQIPVDRSKGIVAFQFAIFTEGNGKPQIPYSSRRQSSRRATALISRNRFYPVFASQARSAIASHPDSPSWSNDDADTLLLAATALFISTLHEIITAERNNSATLGTSFLRMIPAFVRQSVAKFLNNAEDNSINAAAMVDSSDPSLLDWIRVIASSSPEEFLHISRFAKSKSIKDLIYSFACDLKDELEGRSGMTSAEVPLVESMRHDFKLLKSFESWKSTKLDEVTETIKKYSGVAKRIALEREQRELVFPTERVEYYKYILTLCLDHDVKKIEDSGIFLLSYASEKLLTCLAAKWQLSREMREIIFMDVLMTKYNAQILRLFEVQVRISDIMSLMEQEESTQRSEDYYFHRNLKTLQLFIHSNLNSFLDLLKSKELQALTQLYLKCTFYINGGNLNVRDFENFVESLFVDVLMVRYQEMSKALNKKEDLQGMIHLAQRISQDLSDFELCFPDPVFERFNVHLIAQDIYIHKNFILQCDGLKYYRQNKRIVERNAVNLVFGPDGLYMEVSALFEQIGQKPDIVEWFFPFIEDWLKKMEGEWAVWATNTIQNDDFVPILPPTTMYSSSILKFMTQLKTSAERHREEALTVRFLSVSKLLWGNRCKPFANETSREIERLLSTEDTVNFTSQQCVKLNNIMAAIRQLQLTFAELNVSGLNGGGREINPNARRIDIEPVRAYDLDIVDSFSSDPYVRLFIGGEEERDGWKTRVIKTNINPVWNEGTAFRFEPGTLSSFPFTFQVCDEDMIKKNRFLAELKQGDCINFADELFNDYLAHTFEFPLEPKGRLVVKAWREGEVEDRVFWVRKSVQTLEETAEKMVRIFVDKVTRHAELQWTALANGFTPNMFKTTIVLDEDSIEKGLLPLMQYLDSNLSLMNQYLDRPLLDDFLKRAFLNLSPGGFDADAGSGATTQEAATDAPSLISLVLWNELVTRMKCSVESIGVIAGNRIVSRGALGEADKQKVVALGLCLEFLKAFFYCDIDGKCCGFPLAVLENKEYKSVRVLVKEMS